MVVNRWMVTLHSSFYTCVPGTNHLLIEKLYHQLPIYISDAAVSNESGYPFCTNNKRGHQY